MVKTIWNVEDIALALYEYMEEQRDFDRYSTDLFKRECNHSLMVIDEKLRESMPFDRVEDMFALILEYGELKCRQYFIKGFETGIDLKNISIEK